MFDGYALLLLTLIYCYLRRIQHINIVFVFIFWCDIFDGIDKSLDVKIIFFEN